jgi:hypothetical protein
MSDQEDSAAEAVEGKDAVGCIVAGGSECPPAFTASWLDRRMAAHKEWQERMNLGIGEGPVGARIRHVGKKRK